jgi:antitoxin (DNA-binding transcriptional repressor) of toxin-antitoxin stability system
MRADGAGTLSVTAGEEDHVAAAGRPQATITASPFEILRALSGRRSLPQIEGLDWSGARDELAPRMSRYPLPDADLQDG